MAVSDFKNTACVVYPVTWPMWYKRPSVDRLHSTIFFLGDIEEDLGGISKDALRMALLNVQAHSLEPVPVVDKTLFGVENNIPVVKLEPTSYLIEVRQQVEESLSKIGVTSPSEFGYSPHVTVDMETYNSELPTTVWLQPAEIWYRNESNCLGCYLDS